MKKHILIQLLLNEDGSLTHETAQALELATMLKDSAEVMLINIYRNDDKHKMFTSAELRQKCVIAVGGNVPTEFTIIPSEKAPFVKKIIGNIWGYNVKPVLKFVDNTSSGGWF